MQKNLILYGEIACGKTTIIRKALGLHIEKAGGFITVRHNEGGKLQGFYLTPAKYTPVLDKSLCFLEFSSTPKYNNKVFSEFGVRLLNEAGNHAFALIDEFGGLELLIPDFFDSLLSLLRSDTPCVGVFKTAAAAKELAIKTDLGKDYFNKWSAVKSFLDENKNTQLLQTNGWIDKTSADKLRCWVKEYVTGEGL
jgi:nucleoside-triphosphatase